MTDQEEPTINVDECAKMVRVNGGTKWMTYEEAESWLLAMLQTTRSHKNG